MAYERNNCASIICKFNYFTDINLDFPQVAEITFNFWNKFSTRLYDSHNRQLQEFFKPYVLVLIGALCHHCQLDADREGLLDKEDDFAEFRERCSDLVKDVIFVVGSHDCFEKLRGRLNDAQVQVSADAKGGGKLGPETDISVG